MKKDSLRYITTVRAKATKELFDKWRKKEILFSPVEARFLEKDELGVILEVFVKRCKNLYNSQFEKNIGGYEYDKTQTGTHICQLEKKGLDVIDYLEFHYELYTYRNLRINLDMYKRKWYKRYTAKKGEKKGIVFGWIQENGDSYGN